MEKTEVFKKELCYIKNPKYLNDIKVMISLLPDYFFEVPASSTGKYHPSFSLGDGGLVRHTKVAVRIAVELLNNNSIFTNFTSDEKDLIIMSILVHDGLKSGLEKSEYTKFEHPILVSNYIKENKDKLSLNEEELNLLTSMIESHMGEWNTNAYSNVVLPKPTTKYQKFVHMCDFLSSRKFLDVKFENNDIID